MQIRIFIAFLLTIVLFSSCTTIDEKVEKEHIVCNPLDLNYRFAIAEPSRREAADPTVVFYKGNYYLFASKSGGYWYSNDLSDWTFQTTKDLPLEDYAPTAIVIEDTLYFMASSHSKNSIYKSTNPQKGEWELAVNEIDEACVDPAFFLDEDGKLYLFWGCSDEEPLYGVEVNYKNKFAFMGEKIMLKHANPDKLGWEVPGDYNTLTQQNPWIEGAWVNKIDGIYYLQYSGPGTEYKSYSDGVYTAHHPLGPYELQSHNPFAYKPEGFACGAGHGSTFKDEYGNLWHIGTITISEKHVFERRLGLYPVFMDDDLMYANTELGDYPFKIPNKKINSIDDISTGWQLLSYQKPCTASSSIDTLLPKNICDENIRSYWSAQSAKQGEYVQLDLEETCNISAIQLNYADHHTTLLGHHHHKSFKYKIECSNDSKHWETIVDSSNAVRNHPHIFISLKESVNYRYVRLTNIEIPDGYFAISGLRVFGKSPENAPNKIEDFTVKRQKEDRRKVQLNWRRIKNADGYLIKYGVEEHQRYQSYRIFSDTSVSINSLNADLPYFFSIESFNGSGINRNEGLIKRID